MPLETSMESRRRPAEFELQPEPELTAEPRREKCPRCESRDTKFCYYNNYNTSQPRHFCRSCRRYWTLGGSLRNVPIGGSSRNSGAVGANKRFRTGTYPDHAAPLSTVRNASSLLHPPSLLGPTGGLVSSGFRFDLGLGMEMCPAGMMWQPENTWRMETAGGGDCFSVPELSIFLSTTAAEVTGGTDGGR